MEDVIRFERNAKVATIIPTKNEASSIGKVIESLKKYDTEIIVIDGNSSDGTVKVARHHGVEVVEGEGKGKGHDIKLFQNYIQRDPKEFSVYIMLDGDCSNDPDEIMKIAEPIINNEADVVIGSRYDILKPLPGATRSFNRFGNFLLTLFAKFLYQRPDVTDVCSGYWGFSEKFMMNAPISAEGFDLETDVFNLALRNYRVKVVPTQYRPRIGYSKCSLLYAHKIPINFMKYFGIAFLRDKIIDQNY